MALDNSGGSDVWVLITRKPWKNPNVKANKDAFNGNIELNERCYVERLPAELLSHTFTYVTSDPALIRFGWISEPMLLSQVSSRWRALAFATPKLWNNITVDCGKWNRMDILTKAVHTHLRRSGSQMLSLGTTGSFFRGTNHMYASGDPISDLVSPFLSRIRHLTLGFPIKWFPSFLARELSTSELQSLRSVSLACYNIPNAGVLPSINIFARAPALQKFEIKFTMPLTGDSFEQSPLVLPWNQLIEVHLGQVSLPQADLHLILNQCHHLQTCTLLLSATVEASNLPGEIVLRNLRTLTLYIQNNVNFYKYTRNILFPLLENLSIVVSHATRAGSREWSQKQFSNFVGLSSCRLRSLYISADIDAEDIERALGEMPTLVELDVLYGRPIGKPTIRLLSRGLLAPNLETIRCTVDGAVLSDFLDMIDCRYVSPRLRSHYSGLTSIVIRCDQQSEGYREAIERLTELKSGGRDVKVVSRKHG